MNPFEMAKVFNIMPKWRNFAESGHTGQVGPFPRMGDPSEENYVFSW